MIICYPCVNTTTVDEVFLVFEKYLGIKDARSVSLYPYNRSQICQYV